MKRKWLVGTILVLIFTTWFLHNTKRDFPLIFKKDLLAHDESSNSVVAANITRKFFPPMVRINPLNDRQGNWMEGPYWQHIPPLFAYVPYVFFKIDGKISIEVKRLSYAFLVWLTGTFFIYSVLFFSEDLFATFAAFLATLFWINTPFTHELITGYAFGVSDIVLAFTCVLAFTGLLWYFKKKVSGWQLVVISFLVALPIMAKNILGAIPATIFLIAELRDFYGRKDYRKLLPVLTFAIFLCIYYLPLYFSSPSTFKNEILLAFFHFKNLEGWQRPTFYYLTNYLPQRYLFGWTWIYFGGLLVAGYAAYKKKNVLLWLSGGWFIWNLIAISAVTSKVPNFIYQSYLFSLFFIILGVIEFARSTAMKQSLIKRLPRPIVDWARRCVVVGLCVSVLVTGFETVRFGLQFKVQRAQAYSYNSQHEKYYQLAEKFKSMGLDQRDLVIINNPPDDCWERYYILFVTGAESKTLLEMYFNTVPYSQIQNQYRNIYLVDKDFNIQKLDINTLDSVLSTNKMQIEQEISYIKKDKTSCQWLVPDPILNAP